jgi:NADPH-dependent glutamate synthase beta subunit-like oxidoreductase/Pyruvate/2-oxoacid:ferredoxin oxidoreductase delta subunit
VADPIAPIPRISVSSGSTLSNRTGSWKYIRPEYRDSVAPCNARCPTGVDVQAYMELLRRNLVAEAEQLLLRENPMPAITGRVCHHPCEAGCNRGSFDEAVAVHLVERHLGDRILDTLPQPFPRTRHERIAIIGSGPAGLVGAYHPARLGYGVTVFEAAAEAGGMLRLGIPAYRLPRSVLDRQIEWLRACGIDILCNAPIRRDDVHLLLEGFDAVFAATGAHRGRPLGVVGEDGPGIRAGLEFLKAVNRGDRPDVGRRVAVVGGGNTAMDCARAALRLGAHVTVVYRRTRAEMPAIPAEIEEAQREGVAFEFLAAPRALHHADGALVGIECERMMLGEPDASGRRRPVTAPDGAFSMPADLVLTAIGEDADLDSLPADVVQPTGSIGADELGRTTRAKLWAGGDAAGVDRTVSDALGSGKAAAIGIDRALRARSGEVLDQGEDLGSLRWAGGCFSMTRWRDDDPVRRTAPVNRVAGFDSLNTTHFQRQPRHREAVRHDGVTDFAEVNEGLGAADFMGEARRCFNCGVCNECELCLIFCADVAISRSDAGGFIVDLQHCKGCGVCAYECPRGAIVMTREGL